VPKSGDRELLILEIRKLVDLEKACFAKRRRFAFYRYLRAIYRTYKRFRRTESREAIRQSLLAALSLRPTSMNHPIRILIDATSHVDNKTRSRRSLALRYATRQGVGPKDLQQFLEANGGVSGCAERYAALRPKPPRGYLTRHTGAMLVPLYTHPDSRAVSIRAAGGPPSVRSQSCK
jgi:hypothetical protein